MDGALCISLTPATLDNIFASDIGSADLAEVRLDYLSHPQDAENVRWDKLPVPVIAVCRGRAQGGRFDGSVDEEIRILEQAVRNGARFVDIDYRFARRVGNARVIASYHNFEETPADLSDLFERASTNAASIVKIATLVNSWNDNKRLFDLLHRPSGKAAIIVGMGEVGQITRLAGPARGGFLTYAANKQQAAAPGQLTVDEMIGTYRFRKISANTKLLGILGNPVAHSKSPELHNAAFEAAGLDFAYLKFPAADVGDFFESAAALGIHGCSVTIPHKTAVIPFMAELSDTARETGAVNTVSRRNGSWYGDNTDVHGVQTALAGASFDPRGKRVVILGAGGAARAAAVAVKDAAAIVVLTRRGTPAGWETGFQIDRLSNAGSYPCDLLINATPAGMYPLVDECPISGEIRAGIVFDMVYNPTETALLQSAKAQGETVIAGNAMFKAQAARQFEIWTGRTMPV